MTVSPFYERIGDQGMKFVGDLAMSLALLRGFSL
jgi:hypothetical protein